MNPEYRHDWLLFAAIMWISFGIAFGKWPLLVLAVLAIGTANGWRVGRRRRGVERPGGDVDDEQVLRP